MENSRDSTPSCSPTIDVLVIYVLLMCVHPYASKCQSNLVIIHV